MLKLLLELFEEPRGADSSVSVLPVVVDDFGGHSEVIRAIAHSFGASLVMASEGADGVRGTIDDHTKTRIEGLLQVPRAGGGRSRVSLLESEGMIQAAIDGSTEIASRSQREVAGLAAVLCSEQLQGAETALIVYNEDVLDDEWADAIWRLFSDVHETPFMGIGRIILLIERFAGDTLDHHLDAEPSVRFLVRQSGLMRRKPQRVNSADIRHIAERAAQGGLVLFLGAGFSRSSGLPLGDALRDEALGKFLGMGGAGVPELASAFYEYLRENDRRLEVEVDMPREEFERRLTLERVLREEIWRSGASGSPTLQRFEQMNTAALETRGRSVQRLRDLVNAIPGLVLVTVNFDTLVESDGTGVHKMASEADFEDGQDYLREYSSEPTGRPTPLLKLHGSIELRETIVATVDQTAQGLSTAKERCIHAVLNNNCKIPWVYVGYSMRDPDAWSVLQSREFADSVDEYWVSPFADPNALAWCGAHRQFGKDGPTFWQRSITLTADQFLEGLSGAWSKQDD